LFPQFADNCSLVFIIFINLFGQLKYWVGQVLFLVSLIKKIIERFWNECFLCYRACYGVLRFIMESGAKGCEVVVSGKLRGQRAKSMKFVDGLMIHSGDPINEYVDTAVRHVLLRQGLNYFCIA
jgi:hypothetical protein